MDVRRYVCARVSEPELELLRSPTRTYVCPSCADVLGYSVNALFF